MRPAHRLYALALCGCAATGPASRPAPEQPRAAVVSRNALYELAARLPSGADQCVLAAPSRLSKEQRRLFARVSQAQALAWSDAMEIGAYATAVRERRDGSSARVTLLAVRGSREAVRAALEQRGGLALSWDGTSDCEVAPCPVQARFLSEQLLQLEQGSIPPHAQPGVEHRCRHLAVNFPGALELSAWRTRSLALADSALAAQQRIELTAEGVHVTREEVLGSALEGDVALQGGLGTAVSEHAVRVRRERTATGLRTELEVLFEDLELARADEQRLGDAERAAAKLALPGARQEREASGSEDVLAEVGHRLELASRLEGAERASQLTAARIVLEHTLELDPDDERSALLLAELCLTELAIAEPAARLAEQFMRRAGANARWKTLRRHAAALRGEAALWAVLVDDEVVPRARARSVAVRIVQQMGEGASFERAQGLALSEVR